MRIIAGRTAADFDYFYVFELAAPWAAEGHAVSLLNVLNSRALIPDIVGQPVSAEVGSVRLSGRALVPLEVDEALLMWNLPDGAEQMRCHIPRHGIATYRNGSFDWLAAICFECLNVTITGVSATQSHRIMPQGSSMPGFVEIFQQQLDALIGKS